MDFKPAADEYEKRVFVEEWEMEESLRALHLGKSFLHRETLKKAYIKQVHFIVATYNDQWKPCSSLTASL